MRLQQRHHQRNEVFQRGVGQGFKEVEAIGAYVFELALDLVRHLQCGTEEGAFGAGVSQRTLVQRPALVFGDQSGALDRG